jgi:hypothetical protein|nr:MAG TPA: hypothetical protein [Caudoviricetes sp.]
MVPNPEFEKYVKNWFLPQNQDFADELLAHPDIHANWLIGLWYAYLKEKSK